MRFGVSIAFVVLSCACRIPSRDEWVRQGTAGYDGDAMWLCRPDLAHDVCRADLTATELHADGTRSIVPHVPAVEPGADCFYVYPTVDLNLIAGNHVDFTDLDRIRKTARAQIARFSEVCAVYAPLYRQASIGTFLASDDEQARYLAVAYSDVAAAFRYYLEHYNHGRKIVVIGHSQGGLLVTQLLADTFDQDEALRSQLVVAMPIGAGVNTLIGSATGGNFRQLTACTTDAEAGCIVTYRSIPIGGVPDAKLWQVPIGEAPMCVNPGGAGRGPTPLHSYFPAGMADLDGVTTPYVDYPDFYQSRCNDGPEGRAFLEISEVGVPGDRRTGPINLGKHRNAFGLHIYDLQFPQGDLLELVRKKLGPAAHAIHSPS